MESANTPPRAKCAQSAKSIKMPKKRAQIENQKRLDEIDRKLHRREDQRLPAARRLRAANEIERHAHQQEQNRLNNGKRSGRQASAVFGTVSYTAIEPPVSHAEIPFAASGMARKIKSGFYLICINITPFCRNLRGTLKLMRA